MKAGFPFGLLVAAVFPVLFAITVSGQVFPLVLAPKGGQVELSWPAAVSNGAQGLVLPEYEVQYSTDLQSWLPIGGKVRAIQGRSGPTLNLSVDPQPGPLFYRVFGSTNSASTNETGNGGAQVLGYDSQFSTRLDQVGQLSVQDFATNAGNITYLPHLTWDPTTAQYWTNFSSPQLYTDAVQDWRSNNSSTNIPYNYVLDTNEMMRFMTNGFVVSERLGSASFGDAYYRIFNADLPVFVTADSVLQAWHSSYETMLEELEQYALSPLLERLLTNMSSQLPEVWQQYGKGPLTNSILDADYFLTVARSLTSTQQVASALGDSDVEQQVAATLLAINGQRLILDFPIFGAGRSIDFSQFTIRGHYYDSPQLGRYFRTMMWCSRADLRLATFPPNQEDDIRQLGTAIILNHLLSQSGEFSDWAAIEKVTRVFVGVTDSMTFAQLKDLLASAKIFSPADVPDSQTLTNLQTRLLTGELGVQAIQGDFLQSPYSRDQLKLPRSFTVCGQKFIMDSWALSQTVFDRVLWTPDFGTNIMLGKVKHRKPSCLDAAFSVLGNNQVVPELVARMTNENGVPFRDGPHLPYQHNLLAVRDVIAAQDTNVWTDNIYTAWLGALRALSTPTTDPAYPESMRTRAWAMKTVDTQLASWTHLRHDTVLYGKQSYTASILCSYPAGFVEPRPEFWDRMKTLAEVTANGISSLPGAPLYLARVQTNQLAFLTNFATRISTLESISEKELAQQPLSVEETDFLKNTIEQVSAYSNFRQWDGWYPKLFYTNLTFQSVWDSPPSDYWDALVTDVHTDAPDPFFSGDPGAVIHDGVGNVNLLLIAIDNGPDRMVYAGPVLSHYEFEVPGTSRMTDADWKTRVMADQKPPQLEWTTSYLVPGNIFIPPGNQ